ncbi:dihydroneopterin aldolase [Rhodospirillaceae bacterium AH-315-P19]|nr:dihydroneopterin aldolase [Rhodospirillaceae bacterium AH-315-P19]
MSQPDLVRPSPATETEKPFRRVFIRDFILPCQIGVHHHERGRTQRVRVNVDLAVYENAAAIKDRIEEVVCYEAIVAGVRKIAAAGHLNLVETFAEKIASFCLEDARTQEARVRVEKLDVFEDVACVGIEITRQRTNQER